MKKSTSLRGKKILFIGIDFYEYTTAIISKLDLAGASVSFLSTSKKSKIHHFSSILRLTKLTDYIFDRIKYIQIKSLTKDNDFVFILKGENLNQKDIDIIKKHNKNAKFILYFWDDLKRIENSVILLNNFSNIWSFDPEDCEKYGFKYRPLFYRDGIKAEKKEIFISSFGLLHSNRLEIFRGFKNELTRQNKQFVFKLYTDKITLFINKYLKKTILPEDKDLITTSVINYDDMINFVMKSRFILDVPHASQNGLSIRSIEALKGGCHILTTNKGILRNHDIPPKYYTILSGNMKEDLSEINKVTDISDISTKYSIESFINELFLE